MGGTFFFFNILLNNSLEKKVIFGVIHSSSAFEIRAC